MRLGFFTQPVHPPSRDYRRVLQEDREAILLADRLGYCEAFVGEHVTDRAEPVTSSLMFIASLAHDAKRIAFGSAAVTLPSYHPAMVAAHVAMIDHLTDGRFIFGIGPGGLLSDAEMLGNLDLDRNARTMQSIDMILGIWAGAPPYRLANDYWTASTERTLNREIGQGIVSRPAAETASADRGHVDHAAFFRHCCSRRAGVGSDQLELRSGALGGDASAPLSGRAPPGRPAGERIRLACRQIRLRRGRRSYGDGICEVGGRAPTGSTSATS